MARKRNLKNSDLDKLWKNIGRSNARCEVCSHLPVNQRFKCSHLNAHHYIGRKNKRLRWDLRNRVWLCPSHHTFHQHSAHEDPEWFREWFKKYRNNDFAYLIRVKDEVFKTSQANLRELYDELKELYDQSE